MSHRAMEGVMEAAQVKALPVELETTLKLLAQLLTELDSRQEEWMRSGVVRELVSRLAAKPNLTELPAMLLRAHADIGEILGGIRLAREAIEARTVERIHDTKDELSNVTTTTESATLELMNGLDRSLELIDHLETQAYSTAAADSFQELRSQVSALFSHLQFQDITAQQLQGVGQTLLELETRIAGVAALFDHALGAGPTAASRLPRQVAWSAYLPYDPNATMNRDRADQAMIDAAFQGARSGPPRP